MKMVLPFYTAVMVVSFLVFSVCFFFFHFFFFSFRVLFEGINDFHVCLKESFPNLKVGVFFFSLFHG